jgi:glyoxylase-like metal-dependent hydrolase (beta-lactamase superfamily II)
MNTSSLTIKKLVVGQMGTNCYLVVDQKSGEALIIDPGDDAEYISGEISKLDVHPTSIIATHGHFDHIMAACALQLAYNIPFFMHESDAFLLPTMQSSAKHFLSLSTVDPPPKITKFLKNQDTIANLTVLHTPGHTPGGICLYTKKEHTLIVGDTIFEAGGVGRTDFSYSNQAQLTASIDAILSLPPKTILLPGHGNQTSVQIEKTYH